MDRAWFGTGCLIALVGVALSAFGAHGLREIVTADRLEVFRTGTTYQITHGFAILISALSYPAIGQRTRTACWMFCIGILIFSGSLYALSLTGVRGFGAITPLGGIAFMAGWLLLALGAFQSKEPNLT